MGLITAEIPVFILTAAKGKTQFAICFAVFVFVLVCMLIAKKRLRIELPFRISHPVTVTLACFVLAVLFYKRWESSGRIQAAAGLFRLPPKQTCLLITLLLSLLSLTGIDWLVTILLALSGTWRLREAKAGDKLYTVFFLFMTAFLTMLINSKGSPLYPFHDGVDPNTMFTVGKGVLKGMVPYRDLYEQKGPLLIFLHTAGAAVSFDSFLGIWILEIVFCFAFLFLAYRTAALFVGESSIMMIPFLAAAIYSSHAFLSGDAAEEYALPLLAYALYIGCKALLSDELPSGKEFFLIGLTSGCVFWIKYSMIGFYFGWILVMFFFAMSKRQIPAFFTGCIRIFSGAAAATAPILLYFLVNRSLNFLFRSYFYNNLVYYPIARMTLGQKIKRGWTGYKTHSFAPMVLSVLGSLFMIMRKQWKVLSLLLSAFISALFFAYFNGHDHAYYSLILGVFSIPGICFLMEAWTLLSGGKGERPADCRGLTPLTLCTGALLICVFSNNLFALETPKEELFQFKMKSIIEQSEITGPTLLNYRVGDVGVNTAAGLIPSMKYFCYYNNDALKETLEEQKKCLAEQCVDFVIEQSTSPYTYDEIETYDHRGCITGRREEKTIFFHYFTPKALEPE